MAYVRKNLFNAVFVMDAASDSGLAVSDMLGHFLQVRSLVRSLARCAALSRLLHRGIHIQHLRGAGISGKVWDLSHESRWFRSGTRYLPSAVSIVLQILDLAEIFSCLLQLYDSHRMALLACYLDEFRGISCSNVCVSYVYTV